MMGARSYSHVTGDYIIYTWLILSEYTMHTCLLLLSCTSWERSTDWNVLDIAKFTYPRVFVNCLQVSSWQRPSGWNVLQLLINSCVLLISEFRYYQRNYEPLQYRPGYRLLIVDKLQRPRYRSITSSSSTPTQQWACTKSCLLLVI